MVFPAQFGLEIAAIAYFGDDIAVSMGGEHFEAPQDVGVIELFEDIDFGEEEFFQLLGLEGVELNDLDGNCLVCIEG